MGGQHGNCNLLRSRRRQVASEDLLARQRSDNLEVRFVISLRTNAVAKAARLHRVTEAQYEGIAGADAKSEPTREVIIDEWRVSLESWEPVASGSKGKAGTATSRKLVKAVSCNGVDATAALMFPVWQYNITGAELPFWSDEADLADMSGCAAYETTFENTNMANQLSLDLGEMDDAYNVYVNDQSVEGFDYLANRGNITKHARQGTNGMRRLTRGVRKWYTDTAMNQTSGSKPPRRCSND